MHIGQLAADLGISPKTIRYYETIELLPKPQRNPNGYRVYTAQDKERIQFILRAKTVGFSLEEIGEILALCNKQKEPCDHVLDLLNKKLAAIENQIIALTKFRQSVQ